MNIATRFLSVVALSSGIFFSAFATAASIQPGGINVSLTAGEEITLERIVVLDETGPAASKVDVVFLADNTGSMGGVINTVRNSAHTILDAIAGGDTRFTGIDVQFGVSAYSGDPREYGGNPNSAFRIYQTLTNSREDTVTAINSWRASGGGDAPEANFFALHQLATNGGLTDGIGSTDSGIGTGIDIGWRENAAKVIVWFGDVRSHTTTVDINEAIDVLNTGNIIVAAINTRGANSGIDTYQEASQIVQATGGTLTNNVVGTATTVEAILNAVESATDTVDLSLVPEGVPAGLDVTYACISVEGCNDVAAGESRRFAMHIISSDVGTYEFTTVVPQINGLVANDTVNVRACVNDIVVRAKRDKAEIVWTDTGADHYVVYRSDAVDGNYQPVGETTSRYSVYVDRGLTPNVSYYYQVREANAQGDEVCTSPTTLGRTTLRARPDTTPVNVAPEFTSMPITSVDEDQQYEYMLTATDANGDTVSFNLVSGPIGMQLTGSTLSWAPENAHVGDHDVIIQVLDPAGLFDTQLFTVTVTNTNDAPIIISTAPLTARANESYQYAVSAIDIDPGDSLNYTLSQSPAGMTVSATGLIEWIPAFTQQGDFPVMVRVTDQAGAFSEQAFVISVGAVNNPPQITSSPMTSITVGDDYSYQLIITDPNLGDVHEFSIVNAPAGSMIEANTGLFTWNGAGNGLHTITLRVTDYGGLTDTQSFELSVVAANSPPVITSSPVVDAVEASAYSYSVVATDADGDALTYTLTTAPSGMTIDAAGVISWLPSAVHIGPQAVSVEVSDAIASATQTYTVTVAPRPNTVPVFDSVPITSATEGTTYNYDANASDADGDALTFSLTTAPAGMTIDVTTGLIAWTPTNAQVGSHPVTIQVDDGHGGTATQSFNLTVGATPNNIPTIDSAPITTATEGTAYSYDVNASDADGDTLSYSLTTAPTGMVIDGISGLISWTPANIQVGSHPVTVQVVDGNGGTAIQNYTVTVTTVPNNAPTIDSSPVTAATEGAAYSYDVNASDADGDTLSYSLTTAPDGMVINGVSGLISWTPTNAQVGSNPVTVQVVDGNGGTVTQSFSVVVDAAANSVPTIDSMPVTTATEGAAYSYDVNASDADGDTLSYSFTTAPAGMVIDSASGVITWTPTNAQVASHSVTVQVDDGNGGTATQSFSVNVMPLSNTAPSIDSTPATQATTNNLYAYAVSASDPDGDALNHSLIAAPAGMTIDSASGLVNWTPTLAQTGTHPVTVRVDDGHAYVEQSYSIVVSSDALPLDVFISLSSQNVDLGGSTTVTVVSEGGVQPAALILTVDGVPVALDGTGQAVLPGDTIGTYHLVATASDVRESVDARSFYTVRDPADTTVPTAIITTPATDTELTAPAQVIGTADDANLAEYKLLVSPADHNQYTEIAYGTVPVLDGVLGTFDPTLLENGIYDIALIVTDVNGQQSSTVVQYQVTGDMKVGNFSFTVEDLSIPVSGIPITVSRTYDTRKRFQDLDFGYGWTVDYQSVKVEENIELGLNWTMTSSGGLFTNYCIEPVGNHVVTVTLPNGKVEEFDMGVSPSCNILIPPQLVDPVFTAQPGTTSTLVAEDVGQLYYNGGTLLDMGYVDTYDPRRYTLTTTEGYIYALDQDFGIRTVTDPNGNTLTYSSAGIVHSSGTSVNFTRDGQGRITRITDPNGNQINYSYNVNGDLTAVTNQVGAVTQHRYNRSHGLTEYIDPRGITPARNIYDDEGRLIATEDADGNRIEMTHDLAARQEVIRDRLGNVTIYSYDESGYVTAETDALGNATLYTHDERGNELSKTDALGNTISKVFDIHDNPVTETDALGNSTIRNYGSKNELLTVTDKNGNVTTNTYDSRGNLTQIVDPLGNSLSVSVSSSGNLTSRTDEVGSVTSYAYDGSGNRISRSDPLGNVTNYVYDANGNQTEDSRTKTHEGVSVTVTTQKLYDAKNRVVSEIDGEGFSVEYEYNSIDEISAIIDKNGNRTEYDYDNRGDLIRTRSSDGTEVVVTYNEEGGKLSETDQAGNVTTYEYDVLNRLARTIYADASVVENTYDAVGRLIAVTDGSGNIASYTYDAAGRRTSVTGPLGNTTSYTYDPNGNQTSVTDANGNLTQYFYDAVNRRIRTVFPDGSEDNVSYDALGRKIAETDQAGVTSQYAYDPLGRLTQVTDALGGVTSYTYDELGNKLTQTDAEGRTTSWSYDNVGNVLSRTLPLGQTESFTYDGNGNKLTHTSFNGDTVSFSYDSLNRLVLKTYPDVSTVAYRYTPTGNFASVTDNSGTTGYSYDNRDRLVRVDNPDGSYIAYTYDANGNRTALTTAAGMVNYTFDAFNRLETVTDLNGGITVYGYDPVGNRASVSYPNGTQAFYTYDSLNRLIYLENLRSDASTISSYQYTLGAAGNRQSIVESSGRTVNYTYDPLYRLTRESVIDLINGDSLVEYSYDAVANRLSKTVDSLVTVNYTYDSNDRLLSEGATTYTYDANGNTLSKNDGSLTTYTYDYDNRLVQVQTPTSTLAHTYDVNGIRQSVTVDGVLTKHLVDANRDYAQVLEERDASDALQVAYTYGDDLVSQDRSGSTSYYHYDGLGSTRVLTDDSESNTDSYIYEAFGELAHSAGTTTNSYLYAGEQFDSVTGNYYLRNRYMNPSAGRFMKMDKWPGKQCKPVTLNKYLYADSNPVNGIDPSGFMTMSSVSVSFSVQSSLGSIARPLLMRAFREAGCELGFALAEEGINYGIYILFDGANFYVGQSEDINRRHKEHIRQAQKDARRAWKANSKVVARFLTHGGKDAMRVMEQYIMEVIKEAGDLILKNDINAINMKRGRLRHQFRAFKKAVCK